MTDALVIGIATPLAAIIGAGFSYLATRQRDEPAAKVAGDRAALDAWAEFATSVRDELQHVRDELHTARRDLRESERLLDECVKRRSRA